MVCLCFLHQVDGRGSFVGIDQSPARRTTTSPINRDYGRRLSNTVMSDLRYQARVACFSEGKACRAAVLGLQQLSALQIHDARKVGIMSVTWLTRLDLFKVFQAFDAAIT